MVADALAISCEHLIADMWQTFGGDDGTQLSRQQAELRGNLPLLDRSMNLDDSDRPRSGFSAHDGAGGATKCMMISTLSYGNRPSTPGGLLSEGEIMDQQ